MATFDPQARIETKAAQRPFSSDRLAMVNRMAAVDAANLALSAVQDLPPEEMVAGIAILFAATMQRTQQDPFACHVMARRLMRDVEQFHRTNSAVQSLLDFVGLRVVGDPNVSIS